MYIHVVIHNCWFLLLRCSDIGKLSADPCVADAEEGDDEEGDEERRRRRRRRPRRRCAGGAAREGGGDIDRVLERREGGDQQG